MEMQYDDFIASYDSSKAELESSIATISESVVKYLIMISLNCDQVEKQNNETKMDINSIEQMNDTMKSAHELQQCRTFDLQDVSLCKENAYVIYLVKCEFFLKQLKLRTHYVWILRVTSFQLSYLSKLWLWTVEAQLIC